MNFPEISITEVKTVRQKYFHFKVTQTGEPSWLSKKGKRLKMSHWYRKYFRRLVTLFGLYLAPFFHWKLKMCWISLIVLVLALRFIHCTVVVVDLKLWRFSTDGIRREKARERLVCVVTSVGIFVAVHMMMYCKYISCGLSRLQLITTILRPHRTCLYLYVWEEG